MEKGLYVALSGAVAQQRALDEVANNVANATTPGFRAGRISFAEELKRASDTPAPQVKVDSVTPDDSMGPVKSTGRDLDVAINGRGYFAVASDHGVRYTRAGNFHLDQEGKLVTSEGFPILDKNGAEITVSDPSNVTISESGGVHSGGDEVAQLFIGDIEPEKLEHEGQLLRANGTVAALEQPQLVSGALEGSNLNVVRGMVELVRVSRTYESLARMIEGYKEIDQRTARDVGNS